MSNKNCNNCAFLEVDKEYNPCYVCKDDDDIDLYWQPAEPEKMCETCEYFTISSSSEPCKSCGSESNWKSEDEPEPSAKHDTGKPRCDLVSPALIEAVGYVRGYGVKKYHDPENWKSVERERYVAALIRHLCAYMRHPNGADDESGLPHIWHVATNVNFLCDIYEGENQ